MNEMDRPFGSLGTRGEDVSEYSVRDGLRAQMLDLISAYSEDTWCAGWHMGVEDEVRRLGGSWLVLAALCDGWPKGYEAENGWDPLTDDERAEVARLRGDDAATEREMAYALGRDEERQLTVAWLSGCPDCETCHLAAEAIERGEHLPPSRSQERTGGGQ